MAKLNKLKQAQKLYVQENKTLGEIGMKLDLSDFVLLEKEV